MLLISCLVLNACGTQSENECLSNIETPCIPPDEPHQLLSEYGLFSGTMKELEPVEGVLPYDLNTPLFSDYAQKMRMIYVPQGSSITYSESAKLEYPVGSVLVKTFSYQKDVRSPNAGRILLETRLLMHKESGWTGETYIWNEEQTEAVLQKTGASKEVEWVDEKGIAQQVNYLIPSKNDCATCHSQNWTLEPIGPKVRNINRDFHYGDGDQNQLVRWQQEGILANIPGQGQIPKAPVWDDSSTGTLNERARIYLDVNCGNCHSPKGFASYTSFFLNLEEDRDLNLGIYKRPVASGPGSGNLTYDIVPGEPDSSILMYRMESVEPRIRMPEVGRTMVHEEGVALIRAWIDSLECQSCD